MTGSVTVKPSPSRPKPSDKTRSSPGKENLNPLKALTSDLAAVNVRSRRERPCDACRRRKSRCVIKVQSAACVLCEFHRQDCTFVQSPLPRKRKAPCDVVKEDVDALAAAAASKKR